MKRNGSELNSNQVKVLETVYNLFKEKHEWPIFFDVDRKLRRQLDAREVAKTLPPGILRYGSEFDNDHQAVVLSLKAIMACKNATKDLENFMKTLKIVVEKYYDSNEKLAIEWSDLEFLGDSTERVAVVDLLRSFFHFSRNSRGTRQDWSMEFSTNVRELEKIESIENYIEKYEPIRGTSKGPEPPGKSVTEESNRNLSKYEPNTAFILMWITKNQPYLVDIHRAIKESFELFGIRAYRVDELEHQGLITDKVLKSIRESEYLIADLTGERPNVYYEIGYAHALEKKPILIRNSETKTHFDIYGYNCIEYDNATMLKEALVKRIEAITGKKPIEANRKEKPLAAG